MASTARCPALGAKARGRVVDEMVLNLDLAQSLLDFADVPAPKQMQGRSWRPLLTGEGTGWRQSWFYEYFAENQKNSRVPDITAVRTADAKLIKYPGHDEWTELFDLSADLHETRNLYGDPAHASLRAKLETEHDRLARELGYRVPEYVDRPTWWGKPGGPDWKPDPTPGLRLHFDFAKLEGDCVPDLSGHGNPGRVHDARLAQGRDGRQVLRLQGNGWVEVPKSESLDPSERAWTVEAVFKAEKPDGMILARGGKTQGYALWLDRGRPRFTVVVEDKATTVEADVGVSDWTTVVGTITIDRKATLRVNGSLAASAPLSGFIGHDPSDVMQVGADLGSPVVEPTVSKFTGWIERVRLYSGEHKPESP